jgi:OFA family oxalate/formate antiporter-like MFS transporter
MKIINNKWFQLALSTFIFVVISAPQYQWALFVKPLLLKFDCPLSELQIVFSLVVVCMTFITPVAGYFHDRFNTRAIIGLGLIFSSLSWVFAAQAKTLFEMYISYGVLGGLGAGITFIGCTSYVQKLFPNKRGMATGILMSGYAFGPILSTFFIPPFLEKHGIEKTLTHFGFIYFGLGLIVMIFLKAKNNSEAEKILTREHSETKSMMKSQVFWLMYFMMAMIATCGMMITSNISIIAKEHGIGSEIIAFGLAALPLALIIDRITNGFSRIIFGAVSDKIGREKTLAIAFFLEAVFMLFWYTQLTSSIMFVIGSGLVFLAWGEIFSIFPALCTDTFGEKRAGINFGFLYTSVGIGSILGGPLAAFIRERQGNWNLVFTIIIILDLVTASLAYFVLNNERKKFKEKNNEGMVVQNASGLAAAAGNIS